MSLDRPLNVALIGCGFMGKMHGHVYGSLEDARLVAAIDRNPTSRDAYSREFGVTGYESLAHAIKDAEIDVVDICLPTYLHKNATVEAANLGKHVFCEKPMAMSLEEADEMTEACAKNGVKLCIGHCIRFWPEYAKLKQIVDSGELGGLLSLNLTRYGAFPQWASDGWTGKRAQAGGGVLDMHIHDTDFAHYLLGEPDHIVSFGTIDERGPSHVFTTMTYGRTIIHTEGGWNFPSTAPFKMSFRAVFERGAIIMDAGPMTIYREGADPEVPEFPKMAAKGGGNIDDLGGYYFELKYFYERLRRHQPLEIVTPESSRQSLATVLEEIRQIEQHSGTLVS